MKQFYETPELTVVMFENEDIITTSSLVSKILDGYTFEDVSSNFSNWD